MGITLLSLLAFIEAYFATRNLTFGILCSLLGATAVYLPKKTAGTKYHASVKIPSIAIVTFILGAFLQALLAWPFGLAGLRDLAIELSPLAGFVATNVCGYAVARYVEMQGTRETESLMSDIGVKHFRGGFEWFPSIESWGKRTVRAGIAALFGAVVTTSFLTLLYVLASKFPGGNPEFIARAVPDVSGFFGGMIGGTIVGSYFAKSDYRKLKEMYAELDIKHYDAN